MLLRCGSISLAIGLLVGAGIHADELPLGEQPSRSGTRIACSPPGDAKIPYFQLSATELIGGDNREHLLDIGAGGRILGAYSRGSDSLVHVVLQRCETTQNPDFPGITMSGDCKVTVQSYCKGKEQLELSREFRLGKTRVRQELDDFQYLETRVGRREIQLDFALPVFLMSDGREQQWLIANGAGKPWAEASRGRILDLLPFRMDESSPLQLVVATSSRLQILPALGASPAFDEPFARPTRSVTLRRQGDTVLALLDDRLLVAEPQTNGSYRATITDWPIENPARSEVSWGPNGRAGIFLIHRSDCSELEGGSGELPFYAFRIELDAGRGSSIRIFERFSVHLDKADPQGCDVQLVPWAEDSGARSFQVGVFYNRLGQGEWTYSRFRRSSKIASGPLDPRPKKKPVAVRTPGKLSTRRVIRDDQQLYVLFQPPTAGQATESYELRVFLAQE